MLSLSVLTTQPWLTSLLRFFGGDRGDMPGDAQPELFWTNLPSSWGVFVLLGVVALALYLVFWLYRREIETCPRWVKIVLGGLRACVLLLLVVIYINPAIVYLRQRTNLPTLVVARDASQSMNTADRYSDDETASAAAAVLGKSDGEVRTQRPTRVQLLTHALARDNSKWLNDLSARGRIRGIDFSDQIRRWEVASERAPEVRPATGGPSPPTTPTSASEDAERRPSITAPDLAADGRGTDLGAAIRESLATDNPSAAILFTDGQHTAKDDPRVIAREAKQRGIPLLIVGVGDPSRPRNVRAASVYVRPQVWQDEPFEIDAMIVAQGLDAGEVRVELIEQRLTDKDEVTGEGTVVQTQQLQVPSGGGRLRAQFSHTIKETGRFVYTVRVEPVEDELDDADNQQTSAVVKVLNREKVRVLLVAGAPSWEYRLVQKLLARDKTITLSCWLQTLDEERAQEGNRPITRLPVTKEELFYYDEILLFDPNPQEFDQAWIELLKQFVGEHAGGLLFMAGPKHSGRLLTNARTSELQKLLPVSFGDVGALEVASLLSTNQRAWPLDVVEANVDHPVMRFYPDRQETLQRWETLPGIFWSFPSKEPKPTAQVLLEHSDPTLREVEGARPLMVSGRYGSGHTLYLGFNGSWRWRRAGRQAEFFDKFWIQAVRYLVEGRALEGRRRGYLQTDRDRYELGEKITVTARLQDATYNPLVLAKIEASLQRASGTPETVVLLPIANQPGAYEASLTARETGVHTLRVATPGASDSEGSMIESPFSVEMPSVEANQVWLDKPLLKELAEASGGQYFEINELDKLIAAVPNEVETIEVRSKPDPLWDFRGMLLLLVGLLGAEWFIRKWFKLL